MIYTETIYYMLNVIKNLINSGHRETDGVGPRNVLAAGAQKQLISLDIRS